MSEVLGYENGKIVLNKLYEFREDGNSTLEKVSGGLVKVNSLQKKFKLVNTGIEV